MGSSDFLTTSQSFPLIMEAKVCNHCLKTVKIRLIDRPLWKKLVKIDELCECREHEIYEGKHLDETEFGKN